MIRRPPDCTRTATIFPSTTRFRSVRPLRYRHRPHLAAETDFEARTITLQVPDPFFPFGEVVAHGAKRRPGRSIRFIWLTEGVTLRRSEEHTSELQSLMRISYAVFRLKKKNISPDLLYKPIKY